MTVEEYLNQGRLLDQRINWHLEQLRDLKEMAAKLPTIDLTWDRVQTSPTGDAPFAKALLRIEEMQDKINREIDLLVDLKLQIQEVIQQVGREDWRMMLKYRYLDGRTNEEIGNHLQISIATVKRWHNSAIRKIRLPEDIIVADIA